MSGRGERAHRADVRRLAEIMHFTGFLCLSGKARKLGRVEILTPDTVATRLFQPQDAPPALLWLDERDENFCLSQRWGYQVHMQQVPFAMEVTRLPHPLQLSPQERVVVSVVARDSDSLKRMRALRHHVLPAWEHVRSEESKRSVVFGHDAWRLRQHDQAVLVERCDGRVSGRLVLDLARPCLELHMFLEGQPCNSGHLEVVRSLRPQLAAAQQLLQRLPSDEEALADPDTLNPFLAAGLMAALVDCVCACPPRTAPPLVALVTRAAERFARTGMHQAACVDLIHSAGRSLCGVGGHKLPLVWLLTELLQLAAFQKAADQSLLAAHVRQLYADTLAVREGGSAGPMAIPRRFSLLRELPVAQSAAGNEPEQHLDGSCISNFYNRGLPFQLGGEVRSYWVALAPPPSEGASPRSLDDSPRTLASQSATPVPKLLLPAPPSAPPSPMLPSRVSRLSHSTHKGRGGSLPEMANTAAALAELQRLGYAPGVGLLATDATAAQLPLAALVAPQLPHDSGACSGLGASPQRGESQPRVEEGEEAQQHTLSAKEEAALPQVLQLKLALLRLMMQLHGGAGSGAGSGSGGGAGSAAGASAGTGSGASASGTSLPPPDDPTPVLVPDLLLPDSILGQCVFGSDWGRDGGARVGGVPWRAIRLLRMRLLQAVATYHRDAGRPPGGDDDTRDARPKLHDPLLGPLRTRLLDYCTIKRPDASLYGACVGLLHLLRGFLEAAPGPSLPGTLLCLAGPALVHVEHCARRTAVRMWPPEVVGLMEALLQLYAALLQRAVQPSVMAALFLQLGLRSLPSCPGEEAVLSDTLQLALEFAEQRLGRAPHRHSSGGGSARAARAVRGLVPPAGEALGSPGSARSAASAGGGDAVAPAAPAAETAAQLTVRRFLAALVRFVSRLDESSLPDLCRSPPDGGASPPARPQPQQSAQHGARTPGGAAASHCAVAARGSPPASPLRASAGGALCQGSHHDRLPAVGVSHSDPGGGGGAAAEVPAAPPPACSAADAFLAALGAQLLRSPRQAGCVLVSELEALSAARPLPLAQLLGALHFEATLLAAGGAAALGPDRQLGEQLVRYHYVRFVQQHLLLSSAVDGGGPAAAAAALAVGHARVLTALAGSAHRGVRGTLLALHVLDFLKGQLGLEHEAASWQDLDHSDSRSASLSSTPASSARPSARRASGALRRSDGGAAPQSAAAAAAAVVAGAPPRTAAAVALPHAAGAGAPDGCATPTLSPGDAATRVVATTGSAAAAPGVPAPHLVCGHSSSAPDALDAPPPPQQQQGGCASPVAHAAPPVHPGGSCSPGVRPRPPAGAPVRAARVARALALLPAVASPLGTASGASAAAAVQAPAPASPRDACVSDGGASCCDSPTRPAASGAGGEGGRRGTEPLRPPSLTGDASDDLEALMQWEEETGQEAHLSGLSASEASSPASALVARTRVGAADVRGTPSPPPPPPRRPLLPHVPPLAMAAAGAMAADGAPLGAAQLHAAWDAGSPERHQPRAGASSAASSAPGTGGSSASGSSAQGGSGSSGYVPGRDLEEDLERELAAEAAGLPPRWPAGGDGDGGGLIRAVRAPQPPAMALQRRHAGGRARPLLRLARRWRGGGSSGSSGDDEGSSDVGDESDQGGSEGSGVASGASAPVSPCGSSSPPQCPQLRAVPLLSLKLLPGSGGLAALAGPAPDEPRDPTQPTSAAASQMQGPAADGGSAADDAGPGPGHGCGSGREEGEGPDSRRASLRAAEEVQWLESRRAERPLYAHPSLHAALLELLLRLLVNREGRLDEALLPSEGTDLRLQQLVSLVSAHLSDPHNAHVAAALMRGSETALEGAGAVTDDQESLPLPSPAVGASQRRLLRLLCAPLFEARRLELGPPLRKGAYGVVHSATWVGDDGALVPAVVKRVDGGGASAYQGAATFERVFGEVSALEALQGEPGVCRLLQYGLAGGTRTGSVSGSGSSGGGGGGAGTTYQLVFERCECSLREWRARQPPDPTPFLATYLGLFAQVVEAVGALHVRHIAHLDLKGDNILLRRAGAGGRGVLDGGGDLRPGAGGAEGALPLRAVLADFGEAAMLAPSAPTTQRARGTELFSAPEVLLLAVGSNRCDDRGYDRRKAHGAGLAADVWGLGATLFELLAGCPLFDAKGGVARILHGRGRVVLTAAERAAVGGAAAPAVPDLIEWLLCRDAQWRPPVELVAARVAELRGALAGFPGVGALGARPHVP